MALSHCLDIWYESSKQAIEIIFPQISSVLEIFWVDMRLLCLDISYEHWDQQKCWRAGCFMFPVHAIPVLCPVLRQGCRVPAGERYKQGDSDPIGLFFGSKICSVLTGWLMWILCCRDTAYFESLVSGSHRLEWGDMTSWYTDISQ